MPYSEHEGVALARAQHPAEVALEELIDERDKLHYELEETEHRIRRQISDLNQVISSVRAQADRAIPVEDERPVPSDG